MSEAPVLSPGDVHNQSLLELAHPPGWTNPEPAGAYNLVVLGGGTAGLVCAAGAAGLGAKVALVEQRLLGGDCLNVGCVPSKTLIRAGRAATEARRAAELGILTGPVEVDFGAVMERVRRVRARIAQHDSAQRFRDLGVDVFLGRGRFTGPDTLEVDGRALRFHRAVVATGSGPRQADTPGLAEAGYLTNETVFNLTQRPDRLAVIGAGPIGCELSQALQRLGCQVSLLHRGDHIMGREDPAAARLVQEAMLADGVDLRLDTKVERVWTQDGARHLDLHGPDGAATLVVDQILMGVGRQPNCADLGLEAAGVEWDPGRGVVVDDHLRTSNRAIYAAGDCCLPHQFTHTADAAARIVIQNALFAGHAKLSALNVPWCTYTDPEVAHVGLYAHEAAQRGLETQEFTTDLAEVDRAQTDHQARGFCAILVKKGTDRILGATIVAAHAGDLISEISVAMAAGAGLKTIGAVIHPYPTQAECIRKAADAYNRTRLTPLIKKFLAGWLNLRR